MDQKSDGKLYVTKYALSGGLTVARDWKPSSFDKNFVTVKNSYGVLKVGSDAFLSYSEAVANCEDRRKKRIKSLKKQIEKLEKIVFSENDNNF